MTALLPYIAVVLLIWLSPGIGALLALLAKEELKPGKNILEWTQLLVLLAMLVLPVLFITSWLYVALSIGVLLILLFHREFSRYHFSLLGLWLYAASFNSTFLLDLSALLFLYGMLEGIRCSPTARRKNYAQSTLTFLRYWLFPVLACIPLLLAALV
ncbi:MAG: hypothetical protein V1725_00705 [archaeon]